MKPEFTWLELRGLNIQTLKELEKQKLLKKQEERVYSTIIDRWPFPMHSLELQLIKGNEDELKEIQKKWLPMI